jgi:carbamoyltransferase
MSKPRVIAGVSEGFHDASFCIISNGKILYAGHAERYSKLKNDPVLNKNIIDDAILSSGFTPDIIAYYESPVLKKIRLKVHGGINDSQRYIDKKVFPSAKRVNVSHHKSHAAAGYYTSKFNDACIVVLDAIGEFNTSTIWVGEDSKLKKVYSQNYPVSFGLFYSAFTQLLGLMPNQEEYIMMGMAAYGDYKKHYEKVNKYFPSINNQSYNFHKGISDWGSIESEQDKFDIAASVQMVYRQRLIEFMRFARAKTGKDNLVFMGGCALNSSANTALWDIFNDVWIMPNPGDAGSSIGAAAAVYGKHLDWDGPYLGYDLSNVYPEDEIINALINDKVAPVASGKAEFGPRALGNRSILADPRDPDIKDKVNLIKQRELFRPFAPVVMEEFAHEWFDMPDNSTSPYMQYTFKCLRPELIPSVVHKDGTSRVQTVNKEQHPGLYSVLSRWNDITGVPVLLNTSLNIKGQPLLNDENDIKLWEDSYSTKICR